MPAQQQAPNVGGNYDTAFNVAAISSKSLLCLSFFDE
jgi:hypothetical protein